MNQNGGDISWQKGQRRGKGDQGSTSVHHINTILARSYPKVVIIFFTTVTVVVSGENMIYMPTTSCVNEVFLFLASGRA